MLDRYDVYGVEFDFQRELECFGIGREEIGRDVMTDFIGELRDVVSNYENKYGHKIKIALRGHQKPEYSYQMGFDIGEIAKRGSGFLRINTGKIIGGKVILNLGIAEEINPEKDIRVFINSVPAKYIGSKKCGHPHLTESDIYEFEIDKSAASPTVQMAEIIVSDGVKITVDYADIEIIVR